MRRFIHCTPPRLANRIWLIIFPACCNRRADSHAPPHMPPYQVSHHGMACLVIGSFFISGYWRLLIVHCGYALRSPASAPLAMEHRCSSASMGSKPEELYRGLMVPTRCNAQISDRAAALCGVLLVVEGGQASSRDSSPRPESSRPI